jgi:protein CpxP
MRLRRFGRGIGAAAAAALVIGAAVVGLSAQQPLGRGAGVGASGLGAGASGLRIHAALRGAFFRGVRALELTDDQKAQIKTALNEHREEFRAIARDMIAARSALNDAVTADTFDDAAIKAASAKVAAVEVRAALLRASVHRDVFGLLSPDQQQKAKTMRNNAKARIRTAIDRALAQ